MPRTNDRAAQYRARRQLLRMARGLVRKAFADGPPEGGRSPAPAATRALGGDGAALVPAAARTDTLRRFVRSHPSVAAATLASWIAADRSQGESDPT